MTSPASDFPVFTDTPAHAGLEDWLSYPESLTEKLRARAGHARLELLNQEPVPTTPWDRECLGIQEETILRREIRMWDAANPCWYAMTVIPASVWYAHALFFDRLRVEPMGALLFSESSVLRTCFRTTGVKLSPALFLRMSGIITPYTCIRAARFSAYSLQEGGAFYLLEVLLPGLESYCT